MQINYDKLPEITREILVNFFKPHAMDIDDLSLINAINAKLAQFVSHHRVKFVGNMGEAIINYYAINIVPSGGGKDQGLNMINEHVLNKFNKDFYENRDNYEKAIKLDLMKEAINKYPKNEVKQNAYVDEKTKDLRSLHPEENPDTPQGLYSSCLGFLNYEKGGVFVRDSEFASTLQEAKPEKFSTLNLIMQGFEGSLAINTTKGEKRSKRIKGVPINIALITDGALLVNNQKVRERFLNYLQKGFARRSFVSYQARPEIKYKDDFDKTQGETKDATWTGKVITAKLELIGKKLNYNDVFEPTYDAAKRLHYYSEQCKREYEKFFDREDSIILVDIRQRFWKAYKLSALIGCLNNPEEKIITLEDVEMAIYQVELFHESLKEYIGAKATSEGEKVFKYLLSSGGKCTTTDIKEQKFVNYPDFKRFWEQTEPDVEEYARRKGYIFKKEKFSTRGVYYWVEENMLGKGIEDEISDEDMLC